MTTLRILFADAPAVDRADAWALFDDTGACVRTGRNRPGEWPAASRVEAVVAASRVRIATVTLPPLAPSRVASAAAFAVEDQLAGPQGSPHLAASARQSDGRVRVVVVDRALVTALHAGPLRMARVVAEPDLVAADGAWHWCTSATGGGFVRRSDGSAFPVAPPVAGASLPTEMALALAQARRGGEAQVAVRVEADIAANDLARWQGETGVPFTRGAILQWHAATPAAYAAAVDLLQGDYALVPAAPPGSRRRLFLPAAGLAVTALAVHVLATIADWSALRVEAWRQGREWTALAATAGLASDAAATPSSAQAALAHRYAESRHAHGLPAPEDALPLLTRASAALGALPPGAVKSAMYVDGHWTLDLARGDAAQVEALDARLREAGVPALLATTANGARVRIGAP
jgi:type II secretion system protein L